MKYPCYRVQAGIEQKHVQFSCLDFLPYSFQEHM